MENRLKDCGFISVGTVDKDGTLVPNGSPYNSDHYASMGDFIVYQTMNVLAEYGLLTRWELNRADEEYSWADGLFVMAKAVAFKNIEALHCHVGRSKTYEVDGYTYLRIGAYDGMDDLEYTRSQDGTIEMVEGGLTFGSIHSAYGFYNTCWIERETCNDMS